MIVGVNKWKHGPHWNLGLQTKNTLEMLGVIFSSDGHSNPHVNNSILKCRRSYYSLSGFGMSFPGLNVEIKRYSVCVPTLKYGLETMYLSNFQLKKLESIYTRHSFKVISLPEYTQSSLKLRAMNIVPVGEIVKNTVCGLWHRIVMVDSPMRDLCSFFMATYIVSGSVCHKTLFSRVLKLSISPLLSSPNANAYKSPKIILTCGTKDSLATLLRDLTIQSRESVSLKFLRLLTGY